MLENKLEKVKKNVRIRRNPFQLGVRKNIAAVAERVVA